MDDFLEQLATKLQRAAKAPNVSAYKPNSPIHQQFHTSPNVGRILRGGNRSGKTVAGAVEGIWRAIGQHIYQETHDVPTRGRIVTVDIEAGINQIIIPVLKQWIPPSHLINNSWEDSFKRQQKLLTFRNGSTIEFKTHQQELDSFAGVPLHWVWFDEECPQDIFNECRLRLIDYNGKWWMTMTPVEGQDWIFDRFIVTQNKNVSMFEVSINDNPHLNQEALALLDEDLDEDQKLVRQQGIFVPRGGLILKEFDFSRHVIPENFEVPKGWTVYVSIDHGWNNPTAILWHAVSPQGDVITFNEIYKKKVLIRDHAHAILQFNRERQIKPFLYIGDPQMVEESGETGTSPARIYRDNGIPIMMGKRNVAGRINKMNEYLKYDKWHIRANCISTIKEARGYSFKIHQSPKIADRNNLREEPNKKNDHAMDSSGYFFNMLPPISEEEKRRHSGRSLTETNQQDFPWEVDTSFFRERGTDYGLSFGEIH